MKRQVTLLPLVGFLICAAAVIGYPLVFVRFPATRDIPWASWLLLGLGLALVARGLVRAFGRPDLYRGRIVGTIFGLLALAASGLFAYATLVGSRGLPDSPTAPQVGQAVPEFTLPDSKGQPVALRTLLGPGKNWVVLIFYRGYW